ncbi:MAG: hypothetical protein ACFCGT_03945 [Sandaracinaceae bacterium]
MPEKPGQRNRTLVPLLAAGLLTAAVLTIEASYRGLPPTDPRYLLGVGVALACGLAILLSARR